MFKLRLTPYFARQKRELLSQDVAPHVDLPSAVEDCLSARSVHTSLSSFRQPNVGNLWKGCLHSVWPLLLKSTAISFLGAICATASTLAAMQLLKPGQSLEWMWIFSSLYFLMNCSVQTANYANGHLRNWAGLAAESYLVILISRKLLRLSSLAAAQQSSGNLKILITSDTRNVGVFLDNFVRNSIPALAGLLAIMPLLVHLTGRAGFFGVAVMAMILPVSLALNQISSHFQEKGQGELDLLTSLLGEWVKNIRLIRYLSWDEAFRQDVSSRLRKYMSNSIIQHLMACLIFGLSSSWWMVSVTGVFVASQIFHDSVDLIGFFGSLWLITFLAGYFTHLPNTIRLYGLAAPSMKRIARLLAEGEQEDFLRADGNPEVSPSEKPAKLIFKNVSFQFPNGKKVIRSLSLEIDLTKKLAVVGEVGSGKTTFLKLVCGELPPSEGTIQVEFQSGLKRNLWTHGIYSLYRSHLSYVPQEPFVSSDLLSTNITLSSAIEEAEIMNAAYWAELQADLSALPNGISEEIGESGVNMSGGQRQRLNLARAYFSNRSYMVLDDTLSAVDTKTEATLMERLENRNRGFILVTHRTGELMRVEEVMVMKDGMFVERGTPQTLTANPQSHFTRILSAYETEVAHV